MKPIFHWWFTEGVLKVICWWNALFDKLKGNFYQNNSESMLLRTMHHCIVSVCAREIKHIRNVELTAIYVHFIFFHFSGFHCSARIISDEEWTNSVEHRLLFLVCDYQKRHFSSKNLFVLYLRIVCSASLD